MRGQPQRAKTSERRKSIWMRQDYEWRPRPEGPDVNAFDLIARNSDPKYGLPRYGWVLGAG